MPPSQSPDDEPAAPDPIVAFLAEHLLQGEIDGVDLERLRGIVLARPLASGETLVIPSGAEASLVLLLDGLAVVEARASDTPDMPDTPERPRAPPLALAAGSGVAVPARRPAGAVATLRAVRDCRTLQLAECDYASLADPALPEFDLLLRSLPVAPGLLPDEDLGRGGSPARATPPQVTIHASDPASTDARTPIEAPREAGFLRIPVAEIMSTDLVTVEPATPIADAAVTMRDRRISCLPVTVGPRLVGLVTEADMTARVAATGRAVGDPVGAIMTGSPLTLAPEATLGEAIAVLLDRRISHLPVLDGERLVGLLTQSDLVRRQSVSPLYLVADIEGADSAEDIARATAQIPTLVRSLVDVGGRAADTCRLVTSIADAATRRLVVLAEARLGPAPIAWCWAACGSQGRQEQSGVSDQDNALILADDYDEAAHGAWFEAFAHEVCAGLATAGYELCPGDMMATNPRWRRPASAWRATFLDWIARPVPEAQLLASVMFDLRPIAGDASLFAPLQGAALDAASENTLFVAHMVAHSLGLRPPLGLFGRLATERRGEHRHRIDMKLRGTAPIVDMARLYALSARIAPQNTADRLASDAPTGADPVLGAEARRSLLTAWESVSLARLTLQAELVRTGLSPHNHLDPASLSTLAQEQLRDAFVAVRDVQARLRTRAAPG